MALVFHGVLRSKHATSSTIHLFQTYLQKFRDPNFPGIANLDSVARRRLLAARRVVAYADEKLEASSKRVESKNDNFYVFLSGFEFLSLASSAAVCVYVAVKCCLPSGGTIGILGSKVLACQCVILVFGLMAGVLIRGRQWRRICGAGPASGNNLLDRVEKLEQDLRSCTAVIHALSRRVEKLGIRFRVSRKTLREPIAETAALAQKTSDATHVLAAQDDVLERELVEIQKVLIAMQEQQQKQLELILAIGKTSKLWGDSPTNVHNKEAVKEVLAFSSRDEAADSKIEQMQAVPSRKEGNNKP